ncbi:MAG TPA: hypothetical protein VGN98_06915 [Tianweitania sediminis]|jgi:hypothetical protein|nr:hypothetical protein [Tianweitania sediminis]
MIANDNPEPPFFEAVRDGDAWHLYLVTGGRNGDYELLATFESHHAVEVFFAHLGSLK